VFFVCRNSYPLQFLTNGLDWPFDTFYFFWRLSFLKFYLLCIYTIMPLWRASYHAKDNCTAISNNRKIFNNWSFNRLWAICVYKFFIALYLTLLYDTSLLLCFFLFICYFITAFIRISEYDLIKKLKHIILSSL